MKGKLPINEAINERWYRAKSCNYGARSFHRGGLYSSPWNSGRSQRPSSKKGGLRTRM